MIQPWQSFGILVSAYLRLIYLTFSIASIVPIRRGPASLEVLGSVSQSPAGLLKRIEVPSRFEVLRALGPSFVCICLFFKARLLYLGSALQSCLAYMGHSGCYA